MLDPIDGTKSFISGMPAWGTLIGLMRLGEPVFGMMHQPFTRERFSGDGGAARYRGPAGRPRSARARLRAPRATRCCSRTSPASDERGATARLRGVEDKVQLSRYGGDCYAYCMLAAGQIDLVIETEFKPHDIVALIPIITGAGGIVTTWENGPAQAGGRIVVGRRQARARRRARVPDHRKGRRPARLRLPPDAAAEIRCRRGRSGR